MVFGGVQTEPGRFSQRLGSDHGFVDLTKPETLPCVCWDSHDRGRVHGETGGGLAAIGWEAKKIRSVAASIDIQKYVFYSIDKCEKYRDVPLMNMKYAVEEYESEWDELCRVETSGLCSRDWNTPWVLEEHSVGYRRRHENGVLGHQDVAQMTMAAVRREEANGKVLTLAGPKAYTVNQVIQLCEKLGGNEAKVSKVPVLLLKFTRGLTRFFQWTSAVRTVWRLRKS